MADIFDDMMETAGVVPDNVNDRPVQPVNADVVAKPRDVGQDNISLAEAKAQSEALFRQLGTSMADEKAARSLEQRRLLVEKVYKDSERDAPILEKLAKSIDSMDNSSVGRVAKATAALPLEVAAGATLGVGKAFWSGINAFKEGYNALGKLAEDHKLVEKFDPATPVDLSPFINDNYPETSKVVADIGQAISPAIAAAVTPGGPIAMTTAAITSTYMLMDPKGAGLAELFKDTAIGKTLMLEEAFRFSEKKPEDSEIEGRLKNVLDYAFGEALIGGVIKTIRGMYNGSKQVIGSVKQAKVLEEAPKATEAVPAATKAVEGVPVVTPAQIPDAEVAAAVKAMEDADQLDLETWVKSLDQNDPDSYVPKLDPDPMSRVVTTTPTRFDRTTALEAPTNINPSLVLPKDLSMPIESHPIDPSKIDPKGPLEQGGVIKIESGVTRQTNFDFRGKKLLMNPVVKAYYESPGGKKTLIGRILIQGEPQKGKLTYSSGMTYVRPEFRKMGVATKMYDYSDKYLAKLYPSQAQSQYGRAFWEKRSSSVLQKIIDDNPSIYKKRDAQSIPKMIAEAEKRQKDPQWFRSFLEERKLNPEQPIQAEDSLALDLEGIQADRRARNLSDRALESGDPLDIVAANEALDRVIKVHAIKEVAASEAGRTLGITEGLARAIGEDKADDSVRRGLDILGVRGRAKLLKSYLDAYGGARPMAERFQMMEILRKIPNEKFADEALQANSNFSKVVKQTGFRKITDSFYSVYTNSLLSIKTAANVYVLNQAQSAMEVADHYMRSAIGKVPFIGSGQSTLAEANSFAQGFFKAQRKAHSLGLESLKEGKSPKGFTINGDFTAYSGDMESAAQNSVWGQLYAKGMTIATIPSRIVMSADVVSKYINEYAFLNSYAISEAQQMAKQLNIPKDQLGPYLSKYVDDFMANPTLTHLRNAKDQADKLTQSRSITDIPVIGQLQDALDNDPTGLIRFVFPFFRTSINTVANALERLPVVNLATKEARDALRQGGKARDMMMAKVVNGSLFTFGVYELWNSGIINGPMPNPSQQKALADEGKGVAPYTLDLRSQGLGVYYIRGLDPIGKVLRMGAIYAAAREGQQDMDNAEYLSTVAALAFSQVTPEYMGQYDALLQATSGKDTTRLKEWIATVGANTLIPLRGTAKQISSAVKALEDADGKFAKTVARGETDDMSDFFMAQLKDTIGYGLPVATDIFNRPIKQHWLTAVNPFASVDTANSEVGAMLRQLGDYEGRQALRGFEPALTIDMPSRTYQIPNVGSFKLGGSEYAELIAKMNLPNNKGVTMEQEVASILKNDIPTLLQEDNNYVSTYSDENSQLIYKKLMTRISTAISAREKAAREAMLTSPSIVNKVDKLFKSKKPVDTSSVSIFGGM